MPTTTRSRRSVRAPLRFSDQTEYLPAKFGGSRGANNEHTSAEPCSMGHNISDIPHIPEHNKRVSFEETINDSEMTVVDSWGDEPGDEEQGNSWGPEPQGNSWGDEGYHVENKVTMTIDDHDAAQALLELGNVPETEAQLAERQRAHTNLQKYGKHCAQTGVFTLGCEQDPNDGKWYSQEAWKLWTDSVVNCPEGMIEYHRITVDNDSCSCDCKDDIVYARQVDSIPDAIDHERDLIYYGEAPERIHRVECEYDEYALVNQCFPRYDGGYDLEPRYLITSTCVVYPIEGNTYEDNRDYNPIVDEVVSFLKMRLCDHGYGYDDW